MRSGVRLQRSRVKVAEIALLILAIGVLDLWLGWHEGRIFLAIAGIPLALFALGVLISLLWSFTIDADEGGLTLRYLGVTTRLPWDSVVALSVERFSDDWASPILWLKVTPEVRIKRIRFVNRDGHRAYDLIGLNKLTHPPEMAIALLKEQRADKIDAEDYLSHMAAKRLVSELLKEAAAEADQRTPDSRN